MRRRLHGQIFGALVITGLLCSVAAGIAFYFLRDDPERSALLLRDMGEFIVDELPREDRRAFEAGLRRRAKRLHASISVWDERGTLLGQAGRPLRGPKERARRGFLWARDHALLVNIKLEDGRTVAVEHNKPVITSAPKI